MPQLAQIVSRRFSEIEGHLNRPERKDLERSKQLVKIFKDDLGEHGLSYPTTMSSEIFRTITEHRNKAQQRT